MSREKKLIIFDLGGVILNIDYSLTQKAFASLGVKDVDTIYSQAQQNDLFDSLERGQIDPPEFRIRFNDLIPQCISDQDLDQAWNALLLDLPVNRLDFVKAVKSRFRTCILSNTNAIHIESFEQKINESIGISRFREPFDAIFYSSVIGNRKPDREAFQFVLDHFALSAEEALFIDDSEQHIKGARSMGIESILLKKGEEIEEALAHLIS